MVEPICNRISELTSELRNTKLPRERPRASAMINLRAKHGVSVRSQDDILGQQSSRSSERSRNEANQVSPRVSQEDVPASNYELMISQIPCRLMNSDTVARFPDIFPENAAHIINIFPEKAAQIVRSFFHRKRRSEILTEDFRISKRPHLEVAPVGGQVCVNCIRLPQNPMRQPSQKPSQKSLMGKIESTKSESTESDEPTQPESDGEIESKASELEEPDVEMEFEVEDSQSEDEEDQLHLLLRTPMPMANPITIYAAGLLSKRVPP